MVDSAEETEKKQCERGIAVRSWESCYNFEGKVSPLANELLAYWERVYPVMPAAKPVWPFLFLRLAMEAALTLILTTGTHVTPVSPCFHSWRASTGLTLPAPACLIPHRYRLFSACRGSHRWAINTVPLFSSWPSLTVSCVGDFVLGHIPSMKFLRIHLFPPLQLILSALSR